MVAYSKRAPLPTVKRCAGRCGRSLPIEQFDDDLSKGATGTQSYCPQCKADNTREAKWLKDYGLRPGRVLACLDLQVGRCPCGGALEYAIQHGSQARWSLAVDWDRRTGEVRGLMHAQCKRRPPRRASALLRLYYESPPMRAVYDGVPHIAPCSGLADTQLDLGLGGLA